MGWTCKYLQHDQCASWFSFVFCNVEKIAPVKALCGSHRWVCWRTTYDRNFAKTRSRGKKRAKIESRHNSEHQGYASRQFACCATLRWHNPWAKFRRKLGHSAKTGQNRAATKFGTSRLYEPPVCRLCHLKVAPPANQWPHENFGSWLVRSTFGLFFSHHMKFRWNFACWGATLRWHSLQTGDLYNLDVPSFVAARFWPNKLPASY